MTDEFEYDVFLSHSCKDKAAVRELAERLKDDGLKVWFDEWVIQPGDSIPSKIDEGLECSRTLVLVMSEAAFASDWVTLEYQAIRFRDPLNKERRFIPLRLDDFEIKDTLRQFAYIDWRNNDDSEYGRLLAACRTGMEAQVEFARRNKDRALQASQTFKRHINDDPALRKKFEQQLPEFEAKFAALQQQISDYAEFFEKAFKEPSPKTLDDWTRLATRAGLNPNWILEGNWTPQEVAPFIEGYLQRMKDLKQRTLPPNAHANAHSDKAVETTNTSHYTQLDEVMTWRGWAVGLIAFVVLLGIGFSASVIPFNEGMNVAVLIIASIGGAVAAWFVSGEMRPEETPPLTKSHRISLAGIVGGIIFVLYSSVLLTSSVENVSTYLPKDEIQNVMAEVDGSQDRLKWWRTLSKGEKDTLKSVNDSLLKLEDEAFGFDSTINVLFRVYVSQPFTEKPAAFKVTTNSEKLHDVMRNSVVTVGGKGGKKFRAFLVQDDGYIPLREIPNDATGTLVIDVPSSGAGDYLIVALLVWGPTERLKQFDATLSFNVTSL